MRARGGRTRNGGHAAALPHIGDGRRSAATQKHGRRGGNVRETRTHNVDAESERRGACRDVVREEEAGSFVVQSVLLRGGVVCVSVCARWCV